MTAVCNVSRLLVIPVLWLFLTLVNPVVATAQAPGPLTMDQAVELVQKKFDARVGRAEETVEGGRRSYQLRLLSADGRVWTVKVDVLSGAIQ